MANYDYKLMAAAVCNGEYSEGNIDLAMLILEHFKCPHDVAEGIKVWLEALGRCDAKVSLTIS
jgi:hypothetical protein